MPAYTLDAARAARATAPVATAPATAPVATAPAITGAHFLVNQQDGPLTFERMTPKGKVVRREFHTVEGLLSASPAQRATVQYQSIELNHGSGNYLKVARILRDMAPKMAPDSSPTNKAEGRAWLSAFIGNVLNKKSPSKALQSLGGFIWTLENPQNETQNEAQNETQNKTQN